MGLGPTCLVGCRFTMTSFPPRRLVARGRFPLGRICREVPRVMDRSAFLGSGKGSRAHSTDLLLSSPANTQRPSPESTCPPLSLLTRPQGRFRAVSGPTPWTWVGPES